MADGVLIFRGANMVERFIDVIQAHDGSVRTVNYSPCGRFLISGGHEGNTRIWDTYKVRLAHEAPGRLPVHHVRFSPDGKLWGTINSDGDMCLFQTSNNELVMTTKFSPNAGFEFTPDNRYILGSNSQGRVFLYSIQNKTPLYLHKHSDYEVRALAVSPEGRYLASGGTDCIIRLYDMVESKEKPYLEHHKSAISSLAFNPDKKTLGSSDIGSQMCYWDVSKNGSGDCFNFHFNWANHPVNTVAFSPDGLIFATGSNDSRLKLFSVLNNNKRMEDLAGHQKYIFQLCFSPDGKFIATASGDGTIRIWNVKKPHLVS